MYISAATATETDCKDILADFMATNPEYATTSILDIIRDKEFSRLDKKKHAYLDYTGGNLYPESLVCAHQDMLLDNIFGNPHSKNPSSQAASELIAATRTRVLQFFNASDDEYCCVFTSNATGALKIVGESYPFSNDAVYIYCKDNHNSVLGIKEFAYSKGADVDVVSLNNGFFLNEADLYAHFDTYKDKTNKLLAFPAQSNSTGIKHPLSNIAQAQAQGWDVLLDAAAYVPTNKLDLSVIKPDYVCVSFYKIFGYPTGLGCLLIKIKPNTVGAISPFAKLRQNKPWFAGGTVDFVTSHSQPFNGDGVEVNAQKHINFVLHRDYQCFEEGTVNYLDIPAIKTGLDFIESCGRDIISLRIKLLMNWMVSQLTAMQYAHSGHRLAYICGGDHVQQRGSSILIKFYNKDNQQFWCGTLERMLKAYNDLPGSHQLSVRIGTFCNPGIDETCSMHTEDELRTRFMAKLQTDAPQEYCTNKPKELSPDAETIAQQALRNSMNNFPGGMRVSLGIASNVNDVLVFLDFARFLMTNG